MMPEHGGRRLVVFLAIAFVALAVGAGLVMLGPPSRARALQLDRERVRDLQGISSALDNYVGKRGVLPQSLAELAGEPWTPLRVIDPATNEPYRYRVVDASLCEVCARFEQPSENGQDPARVDFWRHEAGEQCFDLRPFSHDKNPVPRPN